MVECCGSAGQTGQALAATGGDLVASVLTRQAESIHGKTCCVLHYNLAYYHCLLGEVAKARERLRKACKIERKLRDVAFDDPDLKAIWGDIDAMK